MGATLTMSWLFIKSPVLDALLIRLVVVLLGHSVKNVSALVVLLLLHFELRFTFTFTFITQLV